MKRRFHVRLEALASSGDALRLFISSVRRDALITAHVNPRTSSVLSIHVTRGGFVKEIHASGDDLIRPTGTPSQMGMLQATVDRLGEFAQAAESGFDWWYTTPVTPRVYLAARGDSRRSLIVTSPQDDGEFEVFSWFRNSAFAEELISIEDTSFRSSPDVGIAEGAARSLHGLMNVLDADSV